MMKISFLGPSGSFSHIAAINLASSEFNVVTDIEFVSMPTITSLVEAISSSQVDQAVIPVENSLAGSVGETLDALLKYNGAYINKEYLLSIKHCLLSKADQDLNKIEKIISHPMSFAQCGDFIRAYCPNAVLEPSASNSKAAIDASKSSEGDLTAAVAPEFCAKLYDLKVLHKAINDSPNNITRFWLLSKTPSEHIEGKDAKTSIIFQIVDEPGSLHKVLKAFSDHGINLSRIESRPSKSLLGSYLFSIDCNAHRDEEKFVTAMRDLSMYFNYYKWLGSYHVSSSPKLEESLTN